MAIDPEPPAATGRGCRDEQQGIDPRADPVHPWSNVVAVAERVQRNEPVIRRPAHPPGSECMVSPGLLNMILQVVFNKKFGRRYVSS
jgi:hypothetical protein